MRIRTLEQLIDRLDNDLAWRKKELSEIKKTVEARKDISEQRHILFVRSAVCILYSHWEGFVKLAANSYLKYVREYVNINKLKSQELSTNFLAWVMKAKLNQANITNKPSLYVPICEFFISELNQRCSFPKDEISTLSNLSSDVLKDITDILGLKFSLFSTKCKLIDEKLLKTRNTIAHGEYLIFDRDEYMELHQEIIVMMNTFKNEIDNAATQENFKKHRSI
ncbi:hypothetical protein JJD41_17405 [Oxynema sp. CENA135]|uniref:MAE_28990/MAE_18760 family HEPN-like nuclease n=1 Tax=Oxynema sp. CENA135 TaxID=984206 RepID=UPI0019092748|nr:MAE_28990/MAE_18760 family HEPN-like nuclease [Oxynema sp. CENA135]MBK4731629.1 hypothetical protein [Oxynema sp. CENA135]